MTSTYSAAGVNLDAAETVVDAIREAVTATWGPNVVGSFGGFAGGFRIPAGYTDPILMMSTDGIGTKLDLARKVGLVEGIGFDLVAMVIDDLAAAGAQALALTDYVAVGRLDPAEVSAIVSSIAHACSSAGVALIGGETAEHPGTLPEDALDVAACAVGVAEGSELLDPASVVVGDTVIGVASPNLRSNGFSLVRAIVGQSARNAGGESIDGRPLTEVLLEPSVIYAPAAVTARDLVKVYAHNTGGGLASNVARVLPETVDVLIDDTTWPEPPVFEYLAERGNVDHLEMRRVFNMGIGFVAIADPDQANEIRHTFESHGHPTYVIGSVSPGNGSVSYSDPR